MFITSNVGTGTETGISGDSWAIAGHFTAHQYASRARWRLTARLRSFVITRGPGRRYEVLHSSRGRHAYDCGFSATRVQAGPDASPSGRD
jgi:hypothetical protein